MLEVPIARAWVRNQLPDVFTAVRLARASPAWRCSGEFHGTERLAFQAAQVRAGPSSVAKAESEPAHSVLARWAAPRQSFFVYSRGGLPLGFDGKTSPQA